ncbi:DNA ligase [bacterium]|nr:DNA ligase [bacterium]
MQNPLNDYTSKRDFAKTPEPEGGKSSPGDKPIFVIQKHDASNLHYDLRLEVNGVLKSWAVPKGPSTDPDEKRLAMPTEDHPIAYARFEGVIPEDEYGGGTVMIWDRGTYINLKADSNGEGEEPVSMEEAWGNGKITVWLEGEKLQGGYALIRTGKGNDARWLFFKMKDEKADARRNPVSTEPDSVASGRSLEEIAEGERD